MKIAITILAVALPFFALCQNVGINVINPTEKFHIQDNASTKLLLKTNSGTSFLTADSPSNSGLLFRSGGLDKGVIFYSPTSNSISSLIGINGWTQFSNGDFRVKERIYSVDELRLDATEQVTIEANGATIVIAPDGNVTIQGNNVSISAEEDLNFNAKNISITAEMALAVSSGGGSSYQAGGGLELSSGADVEVLAVEDLHVSSDNLDVVISQSTNFSNGNHFALTSSNLTISSAANANFNIGSNLSLTAGSDFSLAIASDFDVTVGNNYGLTVGNNYSLGINKIYDLTALSIFSESSGTTSLVGSTLKFNNGTTGIARIGDSVIVGGKVGTITSGSSNMFGN